MPGRETRIQWDMPDKGPFRIQISVDSGSKWIDLARNFTGPSGIPVFPWTPSRELGTSSKCLVQVTSERDTALVAKMPGLFNILQ
jgi:hypothetical protein